MLRAEPANEQAPSPVTTEKTVVGKQCEQVRLITVLRIHFWTLLQ